MTRPDEPPAPARPATLTADEELLCCAGRALSPPAAPDPERIARIHQEIVALISTCHARRIGSLPSPAGHGH